MHLSPGQTPQMSSSSLSSSLFIQLAPMEGVVDPILRALLSEVGGVDRMVTEFVRVTDSLLPDHVFYRYCPELRSGGKTASGTPVFVQLLGGQPAVIADNAARVVELSAPGIDLNFGCPARTVNRHDGGATLLKEPGRLYDVTRAVRQAVPLHIPVTAKVRLGFDHKDYCESIAQAVDEAGACQLVVHARTKTEMYTPPAHWEYLRAMARGRRLRLVANGEIWSLADYRRCVADSGVRDVALGRGLVRDPLLAWRIRAVAVGFDRLQFLLRFWSECGTQRGLVFALARLKQLLRYWSRDDQEAQTWFDAIKVMCSASDADRYLHSLHSKEDLKWEQSRSTLGQPAPGVTGPSNFCTPRA